MLNKIVASVLSWLLKSVIEPAIYYLWDYLRLKKTEKESARAAKELNEAKTKNDTDRAIDNMP